VLLACDEAVLTVELLAKRGVEVQPFESRVQDHQELDAHGLEILEAAPLFVRDHEIRPLVGHGCHGNMCLLWKEISYHVVTSGIVTVGSTFR
jgi:hypothetical protein